MKEVIYPTIKKQFDKLTPQYNPYIYHYNFIDDEGRARLIYNKKNNKILVSIEFFFLNYFGVEKNTHPEDVGKVFIELVEQSTGAIYNYFQPILPEDVFYLPNKDFN